MNMDPMDRSLLKHNLEMFAKLILTIALIVLIVLVIGFIVSAIVSLIEKQAEKKKEREKEKQYLYELSQVEQLENTLRNQFVTTSYDVTDLIYKQAMEIVEMKIRDLHHVLTTARKSEKNISTKLKLTTCPDYYSFTDYHSSYSEKLLADKVYFETDLRKTKLANQMEANAFSYAILYLVCNTLKKNPQNIPLTVTLSQEEITLFNQEHIREATVTITTTNPNYIPTTSWEKRN